MTGSTLGVIGLSVIGLMIAVVPTGQAPQPEPIDVDKWRIQVINRNKEARHLWYYDCRPAGGELFRRDPLVIAPAPFDPQHEWQRATY